MKKAVIFVVVLLLAISSMAIVGCGGDTATAKEYMKKADADEKALEKKKSDLTNKGTAMFMPLVSGDVSGVDLTQLPVLAEEGKALEAEVEDVKAEYKKITTLKGVQDYVDYANAMIEYLDAFKASAQATMEMLEKLTPVIQQVIATGDTSTIMGQLTTVSGDMEKVTKELDAKKEAADKIKKEKKLGE